MGLTRPSKFGVIQVRPYRDADAKLVSIPGHPIAPGDAWIAAAALAFRIPLVTHNRKHFEHVPGLIVVSEV